MTEKRDPPASLLRRRAGRARPRPAGYTVIFARTSTDRLTARVAPRSGQPRTDSWASGHPRRGDALERFIT